MDSAERYTDEQIEQAEAEIHRQYLETAAEVLAAFGAFFAAVKAFDKRGGIQNDLEETQRIILMRDELDDETTLEMLPGIQPEEIPDILRKREEQSQSRYTAMEPVEQDGLTEQEPTE